MRRNTEQRRLPLQKEDAMAVAIPAAMSLRKRHSCVTAKASTIAMNKWYRIERYGKRVNCSDRTVGASRRAGGRSGRQSAARNKFN